jgi:hypothetical protein
MGDQEWRACRRPRRPTYQEPGTVVAPRHPSPHHPTSHFQDRQGPRRHPARSEAQTSFGSAALARAYFVADRFMLHIALN